MTNPPRRWRFQIHLSTAIVLMFVAGGLIWANVIARRPEARGNAWFHAKNLYEEMNESEFFASQADFWNSNHFVIYGWPFDAVQTGRKIIYQREEVIENAPLPPEWRIAPIIYNALIALAILFAVWFLCEWLIRWRAARKAG